MSRIMTSSRSGQHTAQWRSRRSLSSSCARAQPTDSASARMAATRCRLRPGVLLLLRLLINVHTEDSAASMLARVEPHRVL